MRQQQYLRLWSSKGGAMEFGNLMSYGPDLDELFRHSAKYVDKVVRGTIPSDLPVAFPTRYPLISIIRLR
jgi:hypothetical protein